jgi:hypothetical protein
VFGSVHYRGLIPMNVDEFPAMNRARWQAVLRTRLADL